jgi:hypothetical protein
VQRPPKGAKKVSKGCPKAHLLIFILCGLCAIRKTLVQLQCNKSESSWKVAHMLHFVKWAMEIDLGEPIPPVMMPKLDEALRNGTPLKLNGLQIDLGKYKPAIDQEVSDVLNSLYQGLRALEGRIDLILLVGGHTALYETALTTRFPYIPVFLPKQPVYANLRGFYIIGEAQ